MLKELNRASPTSLKISARLVAEAYANPSAPLREVLITDYRLCVHACAPGRDFGEGVRAALIDKDGNPKWEPAELDAVTEESVDARFKLLPRDQELVL